MTSTSGLDRASTGVRWTLVAVLGSAIALFVVLRYLIFPADWGSLVDDLAWTAFSAGAAFCSFAAASRATIAPARRGWRLLGTGAAVWCLGMVYLLWGQFAVPSFTATPTPANWLFMAYAPFFAAGMLHLRSDASDRVSVRRLAELGLIFSAVAVASVVILLEPLLVTGRAADAVLFSVLDPAAFATATLFCLTLYWLGDLRGLGVAGALLLVAIATHLTADLLFFRAVLTGEGVSLYLAPAWLVAFSLQIVAADSALRSASRPAPGPGRDRGRPRRGLIEAALPAPLIIGMALVGWAFRDQLSPATMAALTPMLLLFAISLGFREWWIDRAEERAFRELEASVDLTRRILEASPAAVFSFDPRRDARPTFFSGSIHRLGLDPDERWDWATRLHPEDIEGFRRHATEALTEGSRSFQCRLRMEAGVYRWVNVRLAPYQPGAGGEPILVGALVDIDDVKRLENRLLRTQRMEALGRLSGSIAHDFNNLLTTMMGHAELGTLDRDVPEESRRHFEAIREASRHAAGLTRQLLAFSRRQPIEARSVDLSDTVREMVAMLDETLGETIRIDLRVVPGMAWVRGDPTQLEQIVLNLVVNARDAIGVDGSIDVAIENVELDAGAAGAAPVKPGRYVLLSVTDDGSGMSDEVRERAFEPFFTTKSTGQGTGLGLATVHGIVTQHGGYVDVSSQVGEGSTFRVYLPVSEPNAKQSDAADLEPVAGGGETVLVVDDQPSITRFVREALTSAGYEVLTVNSPTEALGMTVGAAGNAIDLLLTDVVMPEMRGGELAARMRERLPDLRVVFMSGYTAGAPLPSSRDGRPAPFLPKPLALGRLTRTVRQVLDEAPRELDALET